MPDTQVRPVRIKADRELGPYRRLTDDAYLRAVNMLGTESSDELALKLGLANRMVLWRIRNGHYDIRLGQALHIAELLGWKVTRVFEGGTSA